MLRKSEAGHFMQNFGGFLLSFRLNISVILGTGMVSRMSKVTSETALIYY